MQASVFTLSVLLSAPLTLPWVVATHADTLTIATGSVGEELSVLRKELDQFTATTGLTVNIASTADSPLGELGQYQRWLNDHDSSIDVYRVDITWAPQLWEHFVDLSDKVSDIATAELPALVKAETINGELVALPYYADVGALYYRKDLLAKYHLAVPATWADMASEASTIMNGERSAGNDSFWGYAFQGGESEDLTANALEWIASNGGGDIVEDDGTISIDNVQAILAVEAAEKWVGTISPPAVVNFTTEESRALWLAGDAAFARDWHELGSLPSAHDATVHDAVGVAELPVGEHGDKPATTLGGWSVAVSRYSSHRDEAISLVRFLSSAEAQKTYEAELLGHLPAITALYDDGDIGKAQPDIAIFKRMLPDVVRRPAAQTGAAYGRVSADFVDAMNRSLWRQSFAEDLIQSYRHDLEFMERAGWNPDVPRGRMPAAGR